MGLKNESTGADNPNCKREPLKEGEEDEFLDSESSSMFRSVQM